MSLTEKDIKRFSLIILAILLVVLVFLVVKPLLLTTIGGLILAYIFYPVYKKILLYVKYKNLAASILTVLVILIFIVPLWFLIPLVIERFFDLFKFSQELDIASFIANKIPTASDQLIATITETIGTTIGKIISSVMNSLVNFLLDLPILLLHLFLLGFVFFYALRDADKLKEFALGLSPLNKPQEKELVEQFKNITNSVIYGQVVIGIIEGLLAGLALFIFGVPHALLLTILAVILGILPIIGPGLIWLPVTFYLLVTADPLVAIGYFIYNVVLVLPIDNILRAHWLSKKTSMPQVIALIGMLGGILVFGILGLILGPLILAYFITFLKAYKDKTLSSFFSP